MFDAVLRITLVRATLTFVVLLLCLGVRPVWAAPPLPVKVVVLSMFENGEPTGDKPGELQLWLERNPQLREMPFTMGEYSLYYADSGLLVACLGGGIPNATASTMALGLDERFDLSKAYWLIAGIAGADPQDLSLGSAAWAGAVVDGDLVYEIDAREIPDAWPYGFIPLGASEPADGPQDVSTGWTLDTISFELDKGLSEWAYQLTRNTPLMDTPAMQAFRAEFDGYPLAQRPPFVTRGDTLSASTYWHGEKLNQWANDWLRVYAGESAQFMTSNMEDSGTLTALHRLGRAGRVDPQRVLVLRTASNYTMPPKGRSAAWSTTAEYPDGGLGALDTAQRVGQPVVDALIDNWGTYRDSLPHAQDRIPVVFDTDMAIDDWAALLFLARHPRIELLAVTVSASGEAHCEPGARNALALLDLVDPHNQVPVSCGDSYPMDGYFVFPVPWQKDMDSLSGVAITPSVREPDTRHGVELLHDVLAAASAPVTVLATGPLTNIAQWLERYPGDRSKTDRLVVMGGALDAPGNIIVPGFTDDNPNTRAEWNIYVDPLAADKVLRSDLAIELVGLDVTNHVKVTTDFAAQFKGRVDNPAAAFWDAVLDANQWFIDSGEYYFWDVLAALAVIDRDRFCEGDMLGLAVQYEETDQPWGATSDKTMPEISSMGTPRRHFAAASAGVIEEREGVKNTLFCRTTDAEAAFELFMNTLTSGDAARD
ncbi:inosine/uridine-preferring nucleoside hydrolase [gamma proteobacterium NOR5-3]|nr:inosine/uridine-preferring nucleoside hydrolase [gamma proteobacterium NOR5-3]